MMFPSSNFGDEYSSDEEAIPKQRTHEKFYDDPPSLRSSSSSTLTGDTDMLGLGQSDSFDGVMINRTNDGNRTSVRMFGGNGGRPSGKDNTGLFNPLRQARAEYGDIYSASSGGGGLNSNATGTSRPYHDDNGAVLNLQDLHGYVQFTAKMRRRQRRRELMKACAVVMGFLFIMSFMLGGSIFETLEWAAHEHNSTNTTDASHSDHGSSHHGKDKSSGHTAEKSTERTGDIVVVTTTNATNTTTAPPTTKPTDHPTAAPTPVATNSLAHSPTATPLSHFPLPIGYEMSKCEYQLNQGRSFLEVVDTINQAKEAQCRPEFPHCDWLNPTIPSVRVDKDTATDSEWLAAMHENMHHIQMHRDDMTELDVVLIGDSITEQWEGKDMGIDEPSLQRDREVFEKLFTKHGGGQVEGMAHGVDGDQCANLLYRLSHGEMPDHFNPKVWWIEIGTQDWEAGYTVDAIVAGIINIVLYIRGKRMDSDIVINSILPRGNEKRNGNPHYAAIQAINDRLECFVQSENARARQFEKHPKELLDFFNATKLFVFEDPEVGFFVNPALLPDYFHPSAQGEELWGRKIVQKVLEMTKDDP